MDNESMCRFNLTQLPQELSKQYETMNPSEQFNFLLRLCETKLKKPMVNAVAKTALPNLLRIISLLHVSSNRNEDFSSLASPFTPMLISIAATTDRDSQIRRQKLTELNKTLNTINSNLAIRKCYLDEEKQIYIPYLNSDNYEQVMGYDTPQTFSLNTLPVYPWFSQIDTLIERFENLLSLSSENLNYDGGSIATFARVQLCMLREAKEKITNALKLSTSHTEEEFISLMRGTEIQKLTSQNLNALLISLRENELLVKQSIDPNQTRHGASTTRNI